jgi:hypothetical protein
MRTMGTDIGNISTGQAPMSMKAPTPSAPMPATPKPAIPAPIQPPVPPRITPPEPPSSGIGRKLLYGLIGLGVIAAIFFAVQTFLGRSPTVQPTPITTPTPSVSATLAPSIRSLSSYFRQVGTGVELTSASTAQSDFLNTLNISQPPLQQALRIPVDGPGTGTLGDFLGLVGNGTAPQNLRDALLQDWAALPYGQKEQFDANGSPVTSTNARVRLILIGEAGNASGANQAMSEWETTGLVAHLANLLGIDPAKAAIGTFSSGTYRTTAIRYQNFPYADTSIDWAIVSASNGKNYLVIASSRESIFFAIDQLMQ